MSHHHHLPYINQVDGESYAAANKFLEAMSEAESYHHFGCTDDVLKDYRKFQAEWREYNSLPDAVKKFKTIKSFYEGVVYCSWGHYAANWVWQLKQADMDDTGLGYVLQDLQAATFLPPDWYPFS